MTVKNTRILIGGVASLVSLLCSGCAGVIPVPAKPKPPINQDFSKLLVLPRHPVCTRADAMVTLANS